MPLRNMSSSQFKKLLKSLLYVWLRLLCVQISYARQSVILNLINLIFYRVHPSLKPHILLHSDGQLSGMVYQVSLDFFKVEHGFSYFQQFQWCEKLNIKALSIWPSATSEA